MIVLIRRRRDARPWLPRRELEWTSSDWFGNIPAELTELGAMIPILPRVRCAGSGANGPSVVMVTVCLSGVDTDSMGSAARALESNVRFNEKATASAVTGVPS